MARPARPQKAPFSVFLAAVAVVFGLTLSTADSIGFVPYYIDGSAPSSLAASGTDSQDLALADLPQLGIDGSSSGATTPAKPAVYPERIAISSLGIDLPVQNPSTTDVAALDALLVNGPARYPKSASLGSPGNMVIFAHTSHLPIVHNKMFQAFNQIPNAQEGDIVTIAGSDGTLYLYSVDSVVKATTDDGTKIPLVGSGTKLTLVTCDTLTGKSARFILTATFVGTD